MVQSLRVVLAERVRVTLIAAGSPSDARHTDGSGEIIYMARPRLPGSFVNWNLISHRIGREIERLNPDVIHVHDAAGYTLAWPRGTWGRPIIFTVHGMLDTDIRLGGPGWLRQTTAPARARLIARVERAGRARASDVIVINDYVLELLPDLRARPHHRIANPVDPIFVGGKLPPRATNSPAEIITIGGIWPRKNTLEAIHLLARLNAIGRPANLTIVGPTADALYLAACKAQIVAYDVADRVRFTGALPPAEVVAALDRADLLLVTSRQEIAPMVVAEAHCRGVPAAVPRAFGLSTMVEAGSNGVFITTTNTDADANVLNAYLNTSPDRSAIAATARHTYDADQIARQTVAVYRQAIARQVPRRAPRSIGDAA